MQADARRKIQLSYLIVVHNTWDWCVNMFPSQGCQEQPQCDTRICFRRSVASKGMEQTVAHIPFPFVILSTKIPVYRPTSPTTWKYRSYIVAEWGQLTEQRGCVTSINVTWLSFLDAVSSGLKANLLSSLSETKDKSSSPILVTIRILTCWYLDPVCGPNLREYILQCW